MCVYVARPRDSGLKDTYFTNPLIRPRPADTVRRTLKISARNWQIYRDPVVALRYSMYMSERKRLYTSSSVDRLQLHYLGVYSLLAPALGYYNATLYKRELSENERERETTSGQLSVYRAGAGTPFPFARDHAIFYINDRRNSSSESAIMRAPRSCMIYALYL